MHHPAPFIIKFMSLSALPVHMSDQVSLPGVLTLGDATGACKSISDFLTLIIIIIIINIVQFKVSSSFIVFSPPVISGIHTSQIETRFPFYAKTGFSLTTFVKRNLDFVQCCFRCCCLLVCVYGCCVPMVVRANALHHNP